MIAVSAGQCCGKVHTHPAPRWPPLAAHTHTHTHKHTHHVLFYLPPFLQLASCLPACLPAHSPAWMTRRASGFHCTSAPPPPPAASHPAPSPPLHPTSRFEIPDKPVKRERVPQAQVHVDVSSTPEYASYMVTTYIPVCRYRRIDFVRSSVPRAPPMPAPKPQTQLTSGSVHWTGSGLRFLIIVVAGTSTSRLPSPPSRCPHTDASRASPQKVCMRCPEWSGVNDYRCSFVPGTVQCSIRP
ncbi:hypothetical protein BZA05DRAFT_397021 [Tricharina praecox]|uniref:uncharacterized protein n=1 Tax=Tricharina praecox TaxID=43433 RepID=UPI00221F82E1|nr:uncharacterized protein BZA05DRAFT_397021 [Tricharina praecox]KAI5852157.1 hypothetical protein BZA05DRAFT_397021 [Tricharina praecox]